MSKGRYLPATWACAASLALVSGCASYGGHGLKPGMSRADDVRRTMGEPARICGEGDGGQNWVYPKGPAGYAIFDVHLDKQGVLKSIENVLDERGFARVIRGKSTQNDILCLFGPPYRETYFRARNELVWDYRFMNPWGFPSRFHVMFNDAGVVTLTMRTQEFYDGMPTP